MSTPTKAAPAKAQPANTNTSTANLYEKLANVQSKLKAPKNQWNSFGGYKYRSKEDIFEAAKPLCIEEGLLLTVTDEILHIGDRYYIRATASVRDLSTGEVESSVGIAREEENKKGMDSAQLTGATSSYAGKYALGNLFGLDDTKDADGTNTHGKDKPAPANKKAAPSKAPAPELPEMTDGDKVILLNAIKAGKGGVVQKKLAFYKSNSNNYDEVATALAAAALKA